VRALPRIDLPHRRTSRRCIRDRSRMGTAENRMFCPILGTCAKKRLMTGIVGLSECRRVDRLRGGEGLGRGARSLDTVAADDKFYCCERNDRVSRHKVDPGGGGKSRTARFSSLRTDGPSSWTLQVVATRQEETSETRQRTRHDGWFNSDRFGFSGNRSLRQHRI
jgi:hypothetical protein